MTEKWELDTAHSSVHFTVRHMVVSRVHGRFSKWSGSLQLDEANPAGSRVEVRIDAGSVDTNEAQRDGHLKSSDFFDVEKFPEITFVSTRVESAGKDRLRVTGDLGIHGQTRQIVLDVEDTGRIRDPWGKARAGFNARTSIDRKDFGITFNQALDAGGLLLGDRVDISLEIEAVKPVDEDVPVAAVAK